MWHRLLLPGGACCCLPAAHDGVHAAGDRAQQDAPGACSCACGQGTLKALRCRRQGASAQRWAAFVHRVGECCAPRIACRHMHADRLLATPAGSPAKTRTQLSKAQQTTPLARQMLPAASPPPPPLSPHPTPCCSPPPP
jgi:hypothetical protein